MTVLFQNEDLRVIDYLCTALPGDAPFEEMHERHSLSFVRRGSFGCLAQGRRHELIAGGYFIGAPGAVFTCTHDHHHGGDECLSFQMSAALADEIGGERQVWSRVAAPPVAPLSALGALAQATADGATDLSLVEAGLVLAARFVDLMRGTPRPKVSPSSRDRKRAVRAAQWLDANFTAPLSLEAAAREAALSPFHFLRVFSNVMGTTPNQFLITCRLRHAADMLLRTDRTVTEVALHVGFADLSNFSDRSSALRASRRAASVNWPQVTARLSKFGPTPPS